MQKVVKRITAVVLVLSMVLLNVPDIAVFGEVISDKTISISVKDDKGEIVNDAIIKINGEEVTPEQENNKYQISLNGYDTENLKIMVYSNDEVVSKEVIYEDNKIEYEVALPKRLIIGNNEAYYDTEEGVYVISTPYSYTNEYILNISEEEETAEISFVKETVDADKECDGAELDTESIINGVKIKYTSPGIIKVKCSSKNNSNIYQDACIELHITNTLLFKHSNNSNYEGCTVSKKVDSDEVDTVTMSGNSIGNNDSKDIKLDISADCTEDVVYSLKNEDGFSVNATSGIVTCTKVGSTTVVATSKKTNVTASYKINITPGSGNIHIYKVTEGGRTSINNESVMEVDVLDYYNKTTLDIEGEVRDNLSWAYNDIVYSSTDTNVADIGTDGKITIKGVGSTTIIASATKKSAWWTNISASFTLTVKPAPMNIKVFYKDELISKGTVLELSDAFENDYMEYDSLGNGTGFTLPVDVHAYDIDENEISTNIAITSDDLNIEGKKVENPDDIERNTVREYSIITEPCGIYGSTEYVLKIKLTGQQDNNNGYFTVSSGLKTGADGNKWAEGVGIPVVINGNTIVTDEQDQTTYTYTISNDYFDEASYTPEYYIAVRNEIQPVNKQHLFYVKDEIDNHITQRLYFGVDFAPPVIDAITTTGNITSFGIYDNDSISITINGSDEAGNLYEAYIVNENDESEVERERFIIDSEDDTKGSVTFIFDLEEYLNKSKNYNIYIVDRAGNASEKIKLTTAVNNTLKNVAPNSVNNEVTDNEFLIEKGDVDVVIGLNEASGNVEKYEDESNNHYVSEDVIVDINLYDTGDGMSNNNVSGIASFAVEIYTDGLLKDTINYDFTTERDKKSSYTHTLNTADYETGEDGAITIVVKDVTDNAGNTIESVAPYTIYIDKSSPTAVIKEIVTEGQENIERYGNFYNKKVDITIELSDKVSGIDTVRLYVGDKEYQGIIVDKGEGKAEVTFSLECGTKGNASLVVKDNVKHDRTYNLNEINIIGESRKYESNYIVVENSIQEPRIDEEREPDANGKWYNHSVSCDISVTETGIVSGIKNVKIYINDSLQREDTYTEAGKERYETKLVLDENIIKQLINADGSYTIKVVVLDNAGNEKANQKTLYIDTEVPVLAELQGVEDNSFNTGVVTVITSVNEKHFYENGNATIVEVTRTLDGETEQYTIQADAATSETNRYTFSFDKDGTYTIEVKAKDAAGNNAVSKKISFTLDNTIPVCEITGVTENAYYTDIAHMTLAVIESNYATNNVSIVIKRELNGEEFEEVSQVFNSTQKNSVMEQSFSKEGTYTIKVDAKDAAGNTAVTRTVIFTVDTLCPEIKIKGVKNESTYKGDVIPEISISDNYYKGYSIKLTKTGVYFNDSRTDIDSVKEKDVTEQFIGRMNQMQNGVVGSFDTFEKIQENDGIYVLTVSAEDFAGRITTETVRFSVNRFGSVYTLDNNLTNIIGTYNKSIDTDFVITEYNADRLVEDSVIIRIIRDGSVMEDIIVEKTAQSEDVQTGESGWYQYTYKISAENFKLDGVYMITVSSTDCAGNSSETISYDELSVRFSVDTTKPQLVKVIGLSENLYNADKIDVTYEVFDSISVKEVRVYVNNKLVQKVDKFENVTRYEGVFTIDEGMNQSIRFEVEDMAGNSISSDDEEDNRSGNVISFTKVVTVSENFFVRWYANKVAFFATIGGVVLLIGGTVVFFRKRKSR